MTISEFVNKVGFKVKDEDVKKVNDSMQGIKNTATKLLGAIGIGFSLAGINGLVEEFGRVNNQIKSSVSALEDQEAVQQKILASANKTRSSYADSAKVIASLVKGNKELFADVDEAAKFNNAATMLFKTAGKTNEEIAGLMEGKTDPDYAKCVDLCTKASLHEMILPTIVAIIVPVTVGLILGCAGVVGMLAGATASGFLMAVFMSNSGGAWDNAKKYIESGTHGGKGSDCHKAAVVGDTVGDPFKDTAGPSINILIKLLSMVSIVFAALVVNFSIL